MLRFWETVVEPSLEALQPSSVVEIGSDRGGNTRNLLEFCQRRGARLHAIDPVPKYEVSSWQEEYGDTFIPHLSLSLDTLALIDGMDAVLVDGDHNWYTVFNELKIIEQRCAEIPQSFPLVFLHDIGWPYGRRDLYYDPESIPEDYRKPHRQMGLRPDSREPVEEGGINSRLYNALHENDVYSGVLTAVEDFLKESRERPEFMKLPGLHGLGILVPEAKRQNEELARHLDSLRLTPTALSHLETVEEGRIGALVRASEAEHRARRQREESSRLRRELARWSEQSERELAELRRALETQAEENERRLHEIQRSLSPQEQQPADRDEP